MKILIADDESLVRQSIRLFWLELGIQLEDITEVSNGMSLIFLMQERRCGSR